MTPAAIEKKKEEIQSPNTQLSILQSSSRPKLSRGLRKHIRREKGRIRRTGEDKKETEQKIRELYMKFTK